MSQNILQPSVSWTQAIASAVAGIRLPNLCHMMRCGQIRYIQTAYESDGFQNPDGLIHKFLTRYQRLVCHLRARIKLSALQAQPFYYYLLARTRHYDQFFQSAIDEGADWIVNVGCGSDTRGHRFSEQLAKKGIRVLECDQPDAIAAKQKVANKIWSNNPVQYLPIDLNNESWPEFEAWLKQHPGARIHVMLEGVSPYVKTENFNRFLKLLASHQQPGDRIAYDYKRRGRETDLAIRAGSEKLFGFRCDSTEIAEYHRQLGFDLKRIETSEAMSCRMVRGLQDRKTKLYQEDGLVLLERQAAK